MYTETNETEIPRTVPRRSRYETCIETSKRVRWDIDKDVLRGRTLDFATTFLPDGLSKIGELPFLEAEDRRLLSQIQGRTYANVFGLVERFINAKVLEVSRDHRFWPQPDEVAAAVLSKSTWSVLALTCHIELFTQEHYRQSIEPTAGLSPLFKDVFLFHRKEESQHAILDELEWRREDGKLTPGERDLAVDDFIALVGAVDGLLQMQAAADVTYFLGVCSGNPGPREIERLRTGVLGAYRWQYILSGARHPRFGAVLSGLISSAQADRVARALAPLVG